MAEKIKWVKGIKTIIKMGIKSKSKANNTQRQQTYQSGGLIFESEEAYGIFWFMDNNAFDIVKMIKDGEIDMDQYFSQFQKVKVKETYEDAFDELYIHFDDIARMYFRKEYDPHSIEVDFARRFYDLIDLEHFVD